MSNSALAFAEASAGSLLRSRGVFCPRVLSFHFASLRPPRPRGGRSAGRRYPHFDRARKARTHVCETQPSGANRNGPLGAPPWRFWARSALCVSGVASSLLARATSPPGCRARRGRDPEPPGPQIRPHPGTPHLAPPSGSSPETPLVSEDDLTLQYLRIVVNRNMR